MYMSQCASAPNQPGLLDERGFQMKWRSQCASAPNQPGHIRSFKGAGTITCLNAPQRQISPDLVILFLLSCFLVSMRLSAKSART